MNIVGSWLTNPHNMRLSLRWRDQIRTAVLGRLISPCLVDISLGQRSSCVRAEIERVYLTQRIDIENLLDFIIYKLFLELIIKIIRDIRTWHMI